MVQGTDPTRQHSTEHRRLNNENRCRAVAARQSFDLS